MSKSWLVFDTNVVLDLFHFEDAGSIPLRHALEQRKIGCLITPATLEELRRVLAYPEFSLDASRQRAILHRYAALSDCVDALEAAVMPLCSDPDDQKFLELAAAGHAHGLVSKDRALLKLRRRCASHFQIMQPAEALRWLRNTPA
ncbi:MAG: putative toxin-antitoxin system toxin component, PIN family [Thiobacillus sp.]|nr:putative toxin-antitoxin system toxin component, PIN family [Thiobacillus sp.]